MAPAPTGEGSTTSTSLVETSKQGDEEEVDLDSSLIWAIRYLECEAVEEMLAEGAPPAHNCSLQRVGVRGIARPEMAGRRQPCSYSRTRHHSGGSALGMGRDFSSLVARSRAGTLS